MPANFIPYGTARDGFAITRSDTVDVVGDSANTKLYKSVLVHNRSAGGDVKVTTVDGTDLTVFIAQGDVFPLAVRRVWLTGTTPTALVGLIHKD